MRATANRPFSSKAQIDERLEEPAFESQPVYRQTLDVPRRRSFQFPVNIVEANALAKNVERIECSRVEFTQPVVVSLTKDFRDEARYSNFCRFCWAPRKALHHNLVADKETTGHSVLPRHLLAAIAEYRSPTTFRF